MRKRTRNKNVVSISDPDGSGCSSSPDLNFGGQAIRTGSIHHEQSTLFSMLPIRKNVSRTLSPDLDLQIVCFFISF
jgi:hypothetical protein